MVYQSLTLEKKPTKHARFAALARESWPQIVESRILLCRRHKIGLDSVTSMQSENVFRRRVSNANACTAASIHSAAPTIMCWRG
jgi:hypothetical protein